MHTHTKELLEQLTPREAYDILKEGNRRFVNNLKINRDLLQQVNDTMEGQYPFAVVLSCMDSRTSVELIFDQGMGDIFSIRIAGNVVNEDILGSMEYACKVARSKLIVVLGHTRCGAIKGSRDGVKMGHLTGLLKKIQPAEEKLNAVRKLDNKDFEGMIASANVIHGMEKIMETSSIIKELYDAGSIGIVGGMYSVENGHVDFIKEMFPDNLLRKVQMCRVE